MNSKYKVIKETLSIIYLLIITLTGCSNMLSDASKDNSLGLNRNPVKTLFINNNASYAYKRTVTLNLNNIQAEEMRFRNEGDDWTSWENYAPTKAWTLVYGNGLKKVYGEFKDSSGNIISLSDDIVFIDRITPSDGRAGDLFGNSVSVSSNGNIVAIGSYKDDVLTNPDRGSGYVYRWDGTLWNEYKITALDGFDNDNFGGSVSLSADGNTLAVGASLDDDTNGNPDRGSVYVYTWNGSVWNLTVKLTAPLAYAENYSYFGTSVSVSSNGDTVVIGACRENVGSNFDQGSAYVYMKSGSTWTYKRLFDASGWAHDQFGYSTVISPDGSIVIVGALEGDVNYPYDNRGRAYVFERDYGGANNWGLRVRLTAPDMYAENNDYFGNSVSVSNNGEIVIIGAFAGDVNALYDDKGAAYIFERNHGGENTWGFRARVTAHDGLKGDRFGTSVSVSADGTTALVGAPQSDVNSYFDQGFAYLFGRNEGGNDVWGLKNKVLSGDGLSGDYFGNSTALSSDGKTAVIGSLQDDVSYGDQGSVYILRE